MFFQPYAPQSGKEVRHGVLETVHPSVRQLRASKLPAQVTPDWHPDGPDR
jgi:hypothetical protein